MRPDINRALDGLAMVADGLRLLDEHYKAIPAEGQDFLDNSGLQYVDAMSVDRLRIAIATMKDCENAA
jgi:uncharacterized phage infection (PIP) family protein YhgE